MGALQAMDGLDLSGWQELGASSMTRLANSEPMWTELAVHELRVMRLARSERRRSEPLPHFVVKRNSFDLGHVVNTSLVRLLTASVASNVHRKLEAGTAATPDMIDCCRQI